MKSSFLVSIGIVTGVDRFLLVGLSHDGWLASSGLLENNNLPNRICSKTGFSSETVTLRVFRYS